MTSPWCSPLETGSQWKYYWHTSRNETETQRGKDGVRSLSPQQQGGYMRATDTYGGPPLPFCAEPTYLGITLVRSLTFCRHLESLRKKLTTRVALMRRLVGSVWGAGARTLRTAALALVYSNSGYYAVPILTSLIW